MIEAVKLEVSYQFPVIWEENVWTAPAPAFDAWVSAQAFPKILVLVESEVLEAQPQLEQGIVQKLKTWGMPESACIAFPGGESAKTMESVLALTRRFADEKLCRHSAVMLLGGGAFLDMAGLAASLAHRGLRIIRFPTTTLSMCDSGVGVKDAVNAFGKKNFLGTFAPPYAVVCDYSLLASLPRKMWLNAVPEALKVAMIRDADFYYELLAMEDDLRRYPQNVMQDVIFRSAKLHIEHIATGGDPFEMGSARPLDFGHWIAHKLEDMSDYAISHGEGVAVGIVIDAAIAMNRGLIFEDQWMRIIGFLSALGFDLFPAPLIDAYENGSDVLYAGLHEFREHLGGTLHITLPNGVGHRIEVDSIAQSELDDALAMLHHFLF